MWNSSHQLHQHERKTPTKPTASPPASANHDGCFATQPIPKNSRSAALCSRSLDFGKPASAARRRLDVAATGSHHLQFSDSRTGQPIDGHQWLAHLRLADDVQCINAVLESTRGGTSAAGQVRVRCLRDLSTGDELQLWFSSELLAQLAIPFLSPRHICGQNAYTCGDCGRTFEFPNPLKMHLATQCDRLTRRELWQRMTDGAGSPGSTGSTGTGTLAGGGVGGDSLIMHHHLQSWLQGAIQQQFPAGGASHQLHHLHQHHQLLPQPFLLFGAPTSIGRPSAFQPPVPSGGSPRPAIASLSQDLSAAAAAAAAAAMAMMPGYPSHHHQVYPSMLPGLDAVAQPQHHHHPHLMAMSNNNSGASSAHHHHNHNLMQLDVGSATANPAGSAATAAAAAAHLETIVSNMGTKQHQQPNGGGTGGGGGGGHLCIYCGKVYSRKYGLKIHIRTHTGFKPLKCPYCARPFGDPSNLNKHVRLHVQGSTIYKCPVAECDKILVRRRDLQRHMQTLHSLDRADDGGEHDGRTIAASAAASAAEAGGEPSAKRARSGSSSPDMSGGSSPSSLFAVDAMSSDDD